MSLSAVVEASISVLTDSGRNKPFQTLRCCVCARVHISVCVTADDLWLTMFVYHSLRGYVIILTVWQLLLIARRPRHVHTFTYENVSHSERWHNIITVVFSNKHQQNLEKIHNKLKRVDGVFIWRLWHYKSRVKWL